MKVVTIIGARPQFIKAAVVSRAFAKRGVREVIVHTGQHHDRNMSDVFFDEMQIPKPDHFLGIHGLSHGAMTGQMLEKVEEVLLKEKPDVVLVYGDTNTTLAGALSAVKLHIPVAHVEAGLRSYNRAMPEEINRVAADHVASALFCPTTVAIENLKKEGIEHGKRGVAVHEVGDVMYDAALFYAKDSAARSTVIAREGLKDAFVLATVHRAENTDDPKRLEGIFAGLAAIAKETQVVLPLHPRTRAKLKGASFGLSSGVKVIDPVGYFDMLELLKHCSLVATDSGGLQKEAYFFKKPCLILRDETEWVELVEAGCNALAGADSETIEATYGRLSKAAVNYGKAFYGDGDAGGKIVTCLTGKHGSF